MIDVVVTAIVTAIITGGVSSVSTVAALRVHISYLRETLSRHDDEIRAAYEAIRAIERRHNWCGT